MADNHKRAQLHRPRVADVVADRLRERILDGSVLDGELLPKQEQLIEEFGVSLPSVREALRILETEGLVTVLRGSTGGAVVRAPNANKVAYMMALVLQANATTLDDVASVLGTFEPACASMAAARPDRAETVVPALRAAIVAGEEAIDDTESYVVSARRFHEELVAGSGSMTFELMVGAVEQLWSAHVRALEADRHEIHAFADLEFRKHSIAMHHAIADAIEAGEASRAAELVTEHMAEPEMYDFIGRRRRVDATFLRH